MIAEDAISGGTTSFLHTPVGTPAFVAVPIRMASATDQVTNVSYGSLTLTEVTDSPLVASGAEGGTCYCYTSLPTDTIPTGAQTVTVTVAAGTPRSVCLTYTAADACEVIDTATINETGVTGDRTVTLTLGGREAKALGAIWSAAGATTGVNPLTDWSARQETDEGSETNYCYTKDTLTSADITAGYTLTVVDAACGLFVAFGEVVSGGGTAHELNCEPGSYTLTGVAQTGEIVTTLAPGSYVMTGFDVVMPLVAVMTAETGSYNYTGFNATLEDSITPSIVTTLQVMTVVTAGRLKTR